MTSCGPKGRTRGPNTVPLHFPTMPCHVGGTTKKWRGTVKKIFGHFALEIVPLHFQIASGAIGCQLLDGLCLCVIC